jgi:hypothetical protein
MTNAQAALEAASRVHQKVAAGSGAGSYGVGSIQIDKSQDKSVLHTATMFLNWLNENS